MRFSVAILAAFSALVVAQDYNHPPQPVTSSDMDVTTIVTTIYVDPSTPAHSTGTAPGTTFTLTAPIPIYPTGSSLPPHFSVHSTLVNGTATAFPTFSSNGTITTVSLTITASTATHTTAQPPAVTTNGAVDNVQKGYSFAAAGVLAVAAAALV
ncbi:hypothetical protein K504DRAFT_451803 [Pleomassaria siparia CBS 279.74]|uniref:Uncharacterized protein n=1 Tax=Pleomassaria siparia CBS 279.74 TaxID=1314801 RepID=A0A6G1JT03_9PLEO|nr:hypothetical protein K504DRAFT_451803 [Pleomassaria siparia CBS 279.74]